MSTVVDAVVTSAKRTSLHSGDYPIFPNITVPTTIFPLSSSVYNTHLDDYDGDSVHCSQSSPVYQSLPQESPSPGSSEFPSVFSDKCSSRECSGDSSFVGLFTSENTDNERSVSEGSLSPTQHCTSQGTSSPHCSRIEDHTHVPQQSLRLDPDRLDSLITSNAVTSSSIRFPSACLLSSTPIKICGNSNAFNCLMPTSAVNALTVTSGTDSTGFGSGRSQNCQPVLSTSTSIPCSKDLSCVTQTLPDTTNIPHPAFRDQNDVTKRNLLSSSTYECTEINVSEYCSVHKPISNSVVANSILNSSHCQSSSVYIVSTTLNPSFSYRSASSQPVVYRNSCKSRNSRPHPLLIPAYQDSGTSSTSSSDTPVSTTGPVPSERQPGDQLIRKRRSQAAAPRITKRRRNVDRSDTSTDSNRSFSLRFLDKDRIQRYNLQQPVVSLPVNICPPTPSPVKNQRKGLCPKCDHTTCICTPIHDSLTHTARKYSTFPFCLNPVRDRITDDLTLLSELNQLSSRRTGTDLLHDNFLSNALRQAAIRSNLSHFYRSPASPSTPSKLLSDELTRTSDLRCTTPPLTMHHPCVSRSNTVKTNLPTKHNRYPEVAILSHRWSYAAPIVCSHCSMQILEPEESVMWNSCDSERLFFCSAYCLKEYKVSGTFSSKIDEGSSSNMYHCETVDNLTSKTTVFILSQPPVTKHNKNRRALSSDKFSRRRRSDPINEIKATTPFRWNPSRWRRFSKCELRIAFSRDNAERSLGSPSTENLHSDSKNRTCSPSSSKTTPSVDHRTCLLCHTSGDAPAHISGRLLPYSCSQWLHLNCIIWCYETYETVSGSVVGVPQALKNASKTLCSHCHKTGAGLPCFHSDCLDVYHLPCAFSINCSFHADRSMYCPLHVAEGNKSTRLQSLEASRRVYVSQDDEDQGADAVSVNHHGELLHLDSGSDAIKMRVGGLIVHNVGQFTSDTSASTSFHSFHHLYPVGYLSTRVFWSYRHINRRCSYHCRIEAIYSGVDSHSTPHPNFVVSVEEDGEAPEFFKDSTCNGVWQQIIDRINVARSSSKLAHLRVINLSGETLFGLNEPSVVRAMESLPGVEHLRNYAFKFQRPQLLQSVPLSVNPTGCARSEPRFPFHTKSKSKSAAYASQDFSSVHIATSTHHSLALRSSPNNHPSPNSGVSKLQQYKHLRCEWRANVSLGRSRIHGLGLYAARDLSKHTYIIEYLGELIRNEVSNKRERLYESQNRGIYMFRVDDDSIVDATMCGGLARYINHSCEPNCTAEILSVDSGSHIILIANRDIAKGEELTYDYKFDIEEDRADRIPCVCGSSQCRKWMN